MPNGTSAVRVACLQPRCAPRAPRRESACPGRLRPTLKIRISWANQAGGREVRLTARASHHGVAWLATRGALQPVDQGLP
jgi:hypothetical protein